MHKTHREKQRSIVFAMFGNFTGGGLFVETPDGIKHFTEEVCGLNLMDNTHIGLKILLGIDILLLRIVRHSLALTSDKNNKK